MIMLYLQSQLDLKALFVFSYCFLAGLVFDYLKTSAIEKSIRFANDCATKVVQKKGVVTL